MGLTLAAWSLLRSDYKPSFSQYFPTGFIYDSPLGPVTEVKVITASMRLNVELLSELTIRLRNLIQWLLINAQNDENYA